MNFDYLGALRAGASPEEIADYLSKEKGYNLEGALKAGAPIMGIVEYLSKEQPLTSRLWEAGKRGIASTVNAAELFGAETPEEISSLVAENVKAQPAPTAIQKKMAEEIKPYQQEYAESSGIGAVLPALSMAGKRAMQFAENPKEFALSSAENLPNSVPGIAGGLLGGTVGSVVPVFGTVVGGVAGGTAAGYPIEKGSAIRDQVIQLAQEKGIDPTDAEKLRPLVKEHLDDIMTKAQKKGLGTAGVDAAVNVLTLGVAGAGERILKKQADDLVDAAQKGKISKSDYDNKLKEIQDKQDARNTLAAKTLRGAGIMGGEMGGEALSEYAGQKYAYGQADPLSVIDEAILGLGQGAGMSASRGLIEKAAGVATNNEVNDALEKAKAFYPTEETDKGYIDGEVIDRTAHDLQQEEELDQVQKDIRDVQDNQEEQRWAQQQRGTIVPPSEFQMPYDGEQKQAEPEIVNQDEDIGTTAAAAATTPQAGVPSGITFKTAKGSTYDVHENGTTTRDKAYRPEHGESEQGKQPVSQQTFYVDKKGLNALGSHFQSTPPSDDLAHQLVTDNGMAAVRRVDKSTGQTSNPYDASITKLHTEPAVGLYPVEVWDNGGTVHFGNKITEVNKAQEPQTQPEVQAQPASELFKSFGIGPTAKIRKEFDNHDLSDPEQAAQVNEALSNFKTKNASTQAKVDAHLTQEPQNVQTGTQTKPAAAIESTGPTGSNAAVMESGGARGATDTGAPEMAVGPTVGASRVPAGDVNVGKRTEQPALISEKTKDYSRLAEQRYNDLQSEYNTVYNDYAADLAGEKGKPEDFQGTQALHHRMVAKVLDDYRNALQELKDTALTLQGKNLTKDDKSSLRASEINAESIKKYLSALGVNEEFLNAAEADPKLLKEAIPQFTESSRQDEKRIAAEKKERPARNEFLDMLEAFTPGKNYYGTGEEKAMYEQAKQDAKAKGVESTQEKALKKYSDEDLKQLRGITKFKYLTLPDAASEQYADSVANSLRRIEREIAKRAGTLDESIPYELPVGKEYGAPLQGAAKTAVDKGSLQGAVNALANAHPDKQISEILHRVKNLVGGVRLQRGKASDTQAGQYDAATNTVTLHPTYGDKEHVVLHEATHAALAKVLSNPNHQTTKEFNTFFNEVKNQLGNEYGGSNLQEFAAEFVGNEHFQELLKNIQTPKKRSMFSAIIDAIARMFGYKQNTSAYDAAVKHLNNVLDIAEGNQVAPIVQTAQGMGAAVSEGFDELGDAIKRINKVPKNAKKTAMDFISNVANGGVQKKLMDLISLNNMADMLSLRGDVSPAVREMSTIVSEGIKKLDNLLNQRASEQAKRTHASSDIMRKMTKAHDKDPVAFDKMVDMAIEASIEEVDVLSSTPPAKASKAAAYKKLRAQFLALEKAHPAAANSYRMMREKYKNDIEEYLDMIKDTLGDSVANQVRNDYAARGLEGYIPFMRFGDFVLEFADPKTDERQVMQFESAKERADFIAKNLDPIGAEYFTHKRLEDVSYNSRRAAPNTLLTKVMQELEAKGASKQQLDAIYQLQLSLMPSTSIAKRAMHRGNVAGMSRDLIRGFATVQNQWDRRLTASKYDSQLLQQIEAIKGAAARSPDDLIHAAAQSITDRTPFMLNPVHGNMTNMLSAFNYHMYIAGNLSSAFVNISSLPLMVWPKLGAQFGFDKASSAMNAVKGKALGDWGSDARYRGLYAAMVDRNQLSSSMDRAILEGRNVATGDHTGIMRAVLNLSSIPFTESEKYNRAVTAMAAYDLAKTKGMKEADAVEYAVRTVEDMHTSGSAANGSKLFQSDLGRIFFTFKSFAWNSAYVAGRAWALAVRNAKNMKQDPNESAQDFAKRQAVMKEAIAQSRRQLLGMYGMSFAFGGVKGLPFYGALSVLATAMHALAGDDDEPWDLEKELEDFVGKNVANGFINELTNLQIGQRTSIVNDLLYRDNPRAVADLGYVGAGALALLGPAGGFLSNVENSYNMFRQGHIERAMEGIMPSSVRNIMKGMRYASEGAVTLKGDPVDLDVSAYSALMQVVGFAPADLSTIQERKSMAKAYEKGITDRRSSILAKYNMAVEAGDQEIIQETYADIDKFNKAIPEFPISGETLRRSVAQRRSNQRKMMYGMTFNDKLRGRIQDEFFSDIDEED